MTNGKWTEIFKELQSEVEKISQVSQREGIVLSLSVFPDGYILLDTHEDKHDVLSLDNNDVFKIRNDFDTYKEIPRGGSHEH